MTKKNNKKGVAIELAIVTLLVIFALCSVLLTVAELSVFTNKRISTKTVERSDVSQIAEDFVMAMRTSHGNESVIDSLVAKYGERYTITKNNGAWIVYDKTLEKPVMKLVFNSSNGELIEYNGSEGPGFVPETVDSEGGSEQLALP